MHPQKRGSKPLQQNLFPSPHLEPLFPFMYQSPYWGAGLGFMYQSPYWGAGLGFMYQSPYCGAGLGFMYQSPYWGAGFGFGAASESRMKRTQTNPSFRESMMDEWAVLVGGLVYSFILIYWQDRTLKF